jgi:hypothetical protein
VRWRRGGGGSGDGADGGDGGDDEGAGPDGQVRLDGGHISVLAQRTWASSATQLSTLVRFSPGAAGEADSLLAE